MYLPACLPSAHCNVYKIYIYTHTFHVKISIFVGKIDGEIM